MQAAALSETNYYKSCSGSVGGPVLLFFSLSPSRLQERAKQKNFAKKKKKNIHRYRHAGVSGSFTHSVSTRIYLWSAVVFLDIRVSAHARGRAACDLEILTSRKRLFVPGFFDTASLFAEVLTSDPKKESNKNPLSSPLFPKKKNSHLRNSV